MTEQEAEKRINLMISEYCFIYKTSKKTLIKFLFGYGYLYKINDILCQVEQDED